MCPDPQIFSIYVDGELPSPWKEKLEKHLEGCPVCREKAANFKQLRELFKKTHNQQRTIVEREGTEHSLTEPMTEQEFIESAKEKIWRRLQDKRRFRRNYSLMRRRVSIPLPAAAVAAALIAILAIFLIRNGQSLPYIPQGNSNFMIATEEEIPIIPTDMNDVLQFLGNDGSEVIILRLPESKNFSRTGEPAIIRASDQPRR